MDCLFMPPKIGKRPILIYPIGKAPMGSFPRNHTIFRHFYFICCFSADKIKMATRKYFRFNIPVYKNMVEESSCRRPYHEEYIQTSASDNLEGLCH